MRGYPGAAELVPTQINELSHNVWNSAVLRFGIQLGVFPLLDNQALASAQVAEHLQDHPRFVDAFLEACALHDERRGNLE